MGMSWIIIYMLLISGGKNELLEYLPTDAYWQNRNIDKKADKMLAFLKEPAKPAGNIAETIKDLSSNEAKIRDQAQKKLVEMGPAILPELKPLLKSDDAEVAARAEAIIKEIGADSKILPTNRLMAIRTLGEIKSKEALPVLEKLLDSKDPFVADYARIAITRINGKQVTLFKPDSKTLASDILLLPKDCGVVGQTSFIASKGFPIENLIGGFSPMQNEEEKTQVANEITKKLLELTDKIGNVRLDAITLGVSQDISSSSGFAIAIFRGQYDCQAVKDALCEQSGIKAEKINGTDCVKTDSEISFLFPSNELIAIVISPPSQKEKRDESVINDITAAIKAGKGTLSENVEMIKLVQSVEGSPAIWAVMKVSDAYREAQVLTPFDTLTLTGSEKNDVLSLNLVAQGTKAEEIKSAVDLFSEKLTNTHQELAKAAERMPTFKALVEFCAGIKVELSDAGKKVTVSGKLKESSPLSILSVMFVGFVR